MKKSILLFGLLSALSATALSPRQASAASGKLSPDHVETIAVHGGTNTNWFTLVTNVTAGLCLKSGNSGTGNRVTFGLLTDDKGKAQMSVLEAALLAGRSVEVTWNDAVTVSGGFCQAVAIYVK